MALREFKKMVPHQELLKLHNRRKLYKRLHYEKVFKRWDKDNFSRELRELYETTTDEDLVFVPRWFRDVINLVNSFEQHRLSGVEDLLERDFIETRYSRLRLSVIEIYQSHTHYYSNIDYDYQYQYEYHVNNYQTKYSLRLSNCKSKT